MLPTAPSQERGISSEERDALIALYRATGGDGWIHREGWLGPAGSECKWYGVECGMEISGPLAGKLTVQGLYLRDNRLVGSLPSNINGLRQLRRLMLHGDAVKGMLPEALLVQFDEGELDVEPSSLIHDVEEVIVDLNNPALLCGGYYARISAGGIRLERRLCRQRGKRNPELYCEYQQGTTYAFDPLGRFLVRSGFFASKEPHIAIKGSDMPQMIVTAKRVGMSPVRRTWNGPPSMYDWSLGMTIEGIIASVKWDGPAKEFPCHSNSEETGRRSDFGSSAVFVRLPERQSSP
jgi:hypothetical protein